MDTTRGFIKQYTLMVNNHMKKWSTFLVIKGMQIKTMKSIHRTAMRKAAIKKSDRIGKDMQQPKLSYTPFFLMLC